MGSGGIRVRESSKIPSLSEVPPEISGGDVSIRG
jgi:hypothetical protein